MGAWRRAERACFDAGADTARLNPGVDGAKLWRELGPIDDPSSWELDVDADTVFEVLPCPLARAAFLAGVAAARRP